MPNVSLLFHDVYDRDPGESGFRSAAADRYKLTVAEFDAQLCGVLEARGDAPLLAPDFAVGDAGTMPFSITVDDGGLSYFTVMADRLEMLNWRGHCFVTTDCIGHPGFLTAGQIRELDARGHVIGSHSASHPRRFSACAPDAMRREWTRSRGVLEDTLGHAVTVASVPGGYFSTAVAQSAAECGIRFLFTSEPTTRMHTDGNCVVAGRFTIRAGSRPDMSKRFVSSDPSERLAAWASWNAKKLVKPLFGSTYGRVADWLLVRKAIHQQGAQ
jgi:peptidoglycan/xylan/chitin deacetylase (PgdA/CDA1 family)